MWSSWQVAELQFPSFWNVLGIPYTDIHSVVSFTPHFSLICLTTIGFRWRNQGRHILRSYCSSNGPARSLAFLDPAFVFHLSGKWCSISFHFQFRRQICLYAVALAGAAASLRHAFLSSLIYVAVLPRTDCLYCSTHGFLKALTSEEVLASFKCAVNSRTHSACVCLPDFLQLLQH